MVKILIVEWYFFICYYNLDSHSMADNTQIEHDIFSSPLDSELLPATSKEVIARAEQLGLIYEPLFNGIKTQLASARHISETMKLPNGSDKLEKQVRNMRTALNMAFLAKERQRYPERKLLERIGTSHPQEFVNVLVNGDGLYFDPDGQASNLDGYLKAYYKSLTEKGFKIGIVNEDAEKLKQEELAFVYKKPKFSESATILDELSTQRVQIPVVVLEYQGGVKKIPILFSDKYLQEAKTIAMYTWVNEGAETTNDVVLMTDTKNLMEEEKFKTIPEIAAFLAHEIDHAVFNFCHDSQYKRLQREIKEIKADYLKAPDQDKNRLQKRIVDLTETALILRLTTAVGSSVAFEGLAIRTERQFLNYQARGLAEFSPVKNSLIDAAGLIKDTSRLENQLYLEMIRYSVGEILTDVAVKSDAMVEQLYLTDSLDRLVIKNPDLLKGLISHLALQTNETARALNELTEEQLGELSITTIKFMIVKGLGKYSPSFILGHEFFDLSEQINRELDSATPEELDRRIAGFRTMDPELVDDASQETGGDKKSVIFRLEGTRYGRIGKRVFEEFNNLFIA